MRDVTPHCAPLTSSSSSNGNLWRAATASGTVALLLEVRMQPKEIRLSIPAELVGQIPPYNPERQGKAENAMLYVSFRDDQTGSAYYVGEYNGEELCWGFIKVVNRANQFADFRLSEVSHFRNNMLIPMHLDTSFQPMTGLQLLKRIERLGTQYS